MIGVPRLLLVTDRNQRAGRPLEEVVATCVSAGIRHVLVRERDLSEPAYDELLARIRACVDERAVILTRTARPDSPGCQLSQGQARPGRSTSTLIGRSAHDAEGVRRARSERADYIVVGPFAPTASKPGYGPSLGIRGTSALASIAGDIPTVAIGGVRPDDLGPLAAAGVSGAAVMGPLMRASDPGSLAREYVSAAKMFT